MATIKDIADTVGVSSATVSRVLNYDQSMSVSTETRKKIFQAAEQLNYTKSKQKQNKSKKQVQIGIVEWYTEEEELDDLYYYSIRVGIEKRARELGYDIIRIFGNDPLSQAQYVDGILAIGKFSQQRIRELEDKSHHLVFVDSDTLSFGHSCVTTDFENSLIAVLNHFLEKKLYPIGILAGEERVSDENTSLTDPRLTTFKDYLSQQNLFNPNFVKIGHFSSESGYELMKEAITELGENLPQAYFISSDAMAIGALRALHEAKISVPERVSIISFNDTSVARYVYPALSTVTVYTEEMGIQGLNILDQMLKNDDETIPYMVKLSTTLTLRESSL